MKFLAICFFGLFIAASCSQTNNIDADEIEDIKLIQVNHPYIGSTVDSIKLDKKLIVNFLSDFTDKREEVYKFYSCYVIKIYFKDGQFISYRTDGQLFEKFRDDNTDGVYFKLNNDINILTKYWGLQPEQFCKK